MHTPLTLTLQDKLLALIASNNAFCHVQISETEQCETTAYYTQQRITGFYNLAHQTKLFMAELKETPELDASSHLNLLISGIKKLTTCASYIYGKAVCIRSKHQQMLAEMSIDDQRSLQFSKCLNIARNSTDPNILNQALRLQASLLEPYALNFHQLLSNQQKISYHEHMCNYLALLTKCFAADPTSINLHTITTESVVKVLNVCIANPETPTQIRASAEYHLGCLKMKIECVEVCNVPEAYAIFKRLSDTPDLGADFKAAVKLKMAEALAAEINTDLFSFFSEATFVETHGPKNNQPLHTELRKLLLSITINKDISIPIKIRAHLAFALSYLTAEQPVTTNYKMAFNSLEYICANAQPLSLQLALGRFYLALLQLLGPEGVPMDIKKGKALMELAIQDKWLSPSLVSVGTHFISFTDHSQNIGSEAGKVHSSAKSRRATLINVISVSAGLRYQDRKKNLDVIWNELDPSYSGKFQSISDADFESRYNDALPHLFDALQVDSSVLDNPREYYLGHSLPYCGKLKVDYQKKINLLQKALGNNRPNIKLGEGACKIKIKEINKCLLSLPSIEYLDIFFKDFGKVYIQTMCQLSGQMCTLELGITNNGITSPKNLHHYFHSKYITKALQDLLALAYSFKPQPYSFSKINSSALGNHNAMPSDYRADVYFARALSGWMTCAIEAITHLNGNGKSAALAQGTLIDCINIQRMAAKTSISLVTQVPNSKTDQSNRPKDYFFANNVILRKLISDFPFEEKVTALVHLARQASCGCAETINEQERFEFASYAIKNYIDAISMLALKSSQIFQIIPLMREMIASVKDPLWFADISKHIKVNPNLDVDVIERFRELAIEIAHFDDDIDRADQLVLLAGKNISYQSQKPLPVLPRQQIQWTNDVSAEHLLKESNFYPCADDANKQKALFHALIYGTDIMDYDLNHAEKDNVSRYLKFVAKRQGVPGQNIKKANHDQLIDNIMAGNCPLQAINNKIEKRIFYRPTSSQNESQLEGINTPTANGPGSNVTDSYPDSTEEAISTTVVAKKTAQEALEREAKKKCLKAGRPSQQVIAPINNSATPASPAKEQPKKVIIPQKNMRTFEKLFTVQNDKRSKNCDLIASSQNFCHKDYRNDVEISRTEVAALITCLGGKYISGKGSHIKGTVPHIDLSLEDQIILNGTPMTFSNLQMLENISDASVSAVASQTMTLTKSPFLKAYQIDQLRRKLLALGYNSSTVICQSLSK